LKRGIIHEPDLKFKAGASEMCGFLTENLKKNRSLTDGPFTGSQPGPQVV
jgi:hypothetical protein